MRSEILRDNNTRTKDLSASATKKRTAVITIMIAVVITMALVGYLSYQRHQTNKNIVMIMSAANEALATQKVDPTIRTTGRFVPLEKFVKDQLATWLSSREAYLAALRQFSNDFSAASLPSDDAALSNHFKSAKTLSIAAKTFMDAQAVASNMQKWQEACDKAGLSEKDRKPFLLLVISAQTSGPDLEMMRVAQKRLDDSLFQFLTFLVDNRDAWIVEDGQLTYTSPTVDKQGRKLGGEVLAARQDLGKAFDHTN